MFTHVSSHLIFRFLLTGSPLEALREAARLRRKEGYKPSSRKNLISSQTLFIQFVLVYEVDLQASALDDFGAFAEFLLISGRSPALVIYLLLKFFFKNGKSQAWSSTSHPRPGSHPYSHLLLRGPPAGLQIDHHQRLPPQACSCMRHRHPGKEGLLLDLK